MSARHKRARIAKLETVLRVAARHIVIESLDGDTDGECADAREFALDLEYIAGPVRR